MYYQPATKAVLARVNKQRRAINLDEYSTVEEMPPQVRKSGLIVKTIMKYMGMDWFCQPPP